MLRELALIELFNTEQEALLHLIIIAFAKLGETKQCPVSDHPQQPHLIFSSLHILS